MSEKVLQQLQDETGTKQFSVEQGKLAETTWELIRPDAKQNKHCNTIKVILILKSSEELKKSPVAFASRDSDFVDTIQHQSCRVMKAVFQLHDGKYLGNIWQLNNANQFHFQKKNTKLPFDM